MFILYWIDLYATMIYTYGKLMYSHMKGVTYQMNEIQFMGYSAKHTEDFVYEFSENHDFYLFILTNTPAYFLIDGTLHEYPAHSAILYAPGQKIYYRACGTEYRNDWLRFITDETFVTKFPVLGVPFTVGDPEYCHNLIKLLTWESSFTSLNSEIIISNLLRVLFLKLNEDSTRHEPIIHAGSLLNLRKQIYNSPQLAWNISHMAERLHLSTGYLQLLYKNMFGISCMEDVIEGRIRMAKDQLMYTVKTIGEISEYCGYNNVEHFCRQFRQVCGCTPNQFRRAISPAPLTNEKPFHQTIAGIDAHILD